MNRVSTKDKGRPVDKKQKYNMNSREFFSKVALMRQLQQEYFKTRSKSILDECKTVEREIDTEIKRVNAIIGSQPKEQELFK